MYTNSSKYVSVLLTSHLLYKLPQLVKSNPQRVRATNLAWTGSWLAGATPIDFNRPTSGEESDTPKRNQKAFLIMR